MTDNLGFSTPHSNETLWLDHPGYRSFDRYNKLPDDSRRVVDDMHAQGYAVLENVLPIHACEAAISDVNDWIANRQGEFEQKRKPDGSAPRIVNLHQDLQSMRNIFLTDRVIEVQDTLFGYPTSLYTSLYFIQGSQQPIHRDVPVFFTQPENFYFGVWYALEDATLENGCLQAIPGGHRQQVERFDIARNHYASPDEIEPQSSVLWLAYQNRVASICAKAGLKCIDVPLKRGDVLIWHPLLPHGGSKITRPERTRHSIVFHTCPQGVPVLQADAFFDWRGVSRRVPSKAFNFLSKDRMMTANGAPHITSV